MPGVLFLPRVISVASEFPLVNILGHPKLGRPSAALPDPLAAAPLFFSWMRAASVRRRERSLKIKKKEIRDKPTKMRATSVRRRERSLKIKKKEIRDKPTKGGHGEPAPFSRRRTWSPANSTAALVTAERPVAMSRESTSATPPDLPWDAIDSRLETWDDPTPRASLFTLDELREACVAAAKRQFSSKTKSPTREERLKYRDEHDRNSLMIALQGYAMKNNMQSTDLEFVEVKERNLIDEYGKGFLHFNFVVKETDGKLTNFFAEVHPDLKDEKDVYLCIPLDEKDLHPSEDHDQAHCYGCKDRAKDLVHPNGGGFLGGHEDVGFPFMELESDEESGDDDD